MSDCDYLAALKVKSGYGDFQILSKSTALREKARKQQLRRIPRDAEGSGGQGVFADIKEIWRFTITGLRAVFKAFKKVAP